MEHKDLKFYNVNFNQFMGNKLSMDNANNPINESSKEDELHNKNDFKIENQNQKNEKEHDGNDKSATRVAETLSDVELKASTDNPNIVPEITPVDVTTEPASTLLESTFNDLCDTNKNQPYNSNVQILKTKKEIDEEIILKSLEYFLKQHFLSSSDLNRSDKRKIVSPYGDDSWNVHELIKHRVAKQYIDMLNDKYKLINENGTSESIPFSFYFDLSDSMSKHTGLLIKMVDKLLSNNVVAIYGYNQYIKQILNQKTEYKSIEELSKIISSRCSNNETNLLIDQYLIERKAERVVVFSDYDPFDAVIGLSKKALVYWFCFDERRSNRNIDSFEGLLFHTVSFDDFRRHINKIGDRNYEIKQRILQKNFDSGVSKKW